MQQLLEVQDVISLIFFFFLQFEYFGTNKGNFSFLFFLIQSSPFSFGISEYAE